MRAFALVGWLVLCSTAGATIATGSYVGDGVAGRAVSGLGFRPAMVLVKKSAGNPGAHTILALSTFPAGTSKELNSNAVGPLAITGLGTDGFTVGSHPTVNDSGATYHWVAVAAVPGMLEVGTYVGDGTDDRAIPGLTFSPDFVIVAAEGSAEPVWRTSTMPDDMCSLFHKATTGGMSIADAVQRFTADGIQVGTDPRANGAGMTFHYLAMRATPGQSAVGVFAGDGTDNRSISGLGFRPDWVLIRTTGGNRGVSRPAALGGDLSLYTSGDTSGSDLVQALDPDGFQVGASQYVNPAGGTAWYVAIGTPTVTGGAVRFRVSGVINPIEPGRYSDVTVEALDIAGSRVSDYAGTATFSSTDPAATLPLPFTFRPQEAGVHTFAGALSFSTPGTHTLTVEDPQSGLIGQLESIVVQSPPVTAPVCSAQSPCDAGTCVDGVCCTDPQSCPEPACSESAPCDGGPILTCQDGGCEPSHPLALRVACDAAGGALPAVFAVIAAAFLARPGRRGRYG